MYFILFLFFIFVCACARVAAVMRRLDRAADNSRGCTQGAAHRDRWLNGTGCTCSLRALLPAAYMREAYASQRLLACLRHPSNVGLLPSMHEMACLHGVRGSFPVSGLVHLHACVPPHLRGPVQAPSGTQPHTTAHSGTQPHAIARSGTQPHTIARSGTQPHTIAQAHSLTR